MTEQKGQTATTPRARGNGQVSGATGRRPGVITFAAIMMFVVAGFEAMAAIFAFAGSGWWVTEAGNLMYANLFLWGIVDAIIAILALYGGIDLLRGGTYGVVVGYTFGVVGAIRWLFVVPAAPVLAVVVTAICVTVVYGLAKHADYFEGA